MTSYKIIKITTLFIISLFMYGCSNKNIIYKTDVQKVNIPVRCEPPKIHCDFNYDGFGVINKMLECIIEQKRALEFCQGKINNTH